METVPEDGDSTNLWNIECVLVTQPVDNVKINFYLTIPTFRTLS
jgi:hypothetical protein